MDSNKKASENLERMFSTNEYGAGDIRDQHGILSQLFRRLLFQSRFNKRNWARYLNDYIRAIGVSEASFRIRTNEKGNLTKALSNKYMTIRTFIKAMKFAKVRKFKLIIEAELENGKIVRAESNEVEFMDILPSDPIDGCEEEDEAESPDLAITSEDDPDYKPIPRS